MDQNFWDKVYLEKAEKEVSWFQEHPVKSLELIRELNLEKDAPILDIGGGDSRLVDYLLAEGYSDITVLDISEVSLQKLKVRLGNVGSKVKYLVSDVTTFKTARSFALLHDRAAFHFLTHVEQVNKYLSVASESLQSHGSLIISTFSKHGPEKCSGLPISNYSETELKSLFEKGFDNTKCFEDTHFTPWGTSQSFVYCGFKKKQDRRFA